MKCHACGAQFNDQGTDAQLCPKCDTMTYGKPLVPCPKCFGRMVRDFKRGNYRCEACGHAENPGR